MLSHEGPTPIGITMVPTDQTIEMAELARAVEDRGLAGLYLPDHSHIPVARTSPYPLGGALPARYTRLLDPFVALALAAAATTRIRLGTAVLLAAQRDPIVTAKALATLDQQSGGRVVVGVGFGWNAEEMADHGVDPKRRRGRLREHVQAMRRLWEDDVASYSGRYVEIAPSWSWPKPPQRPLPVLVGGAASPTVFEHIVDYAQGWMPLGRRAIREGLPQLRDKVSEAGRDPADLEVISLVGAKVDQNILDAVEASGATSILVDVLPGPRDSVLSKLDVLAEVVAARGAAAGG
jgi:probable F420-dependent oxidoreductase